MGEISNGRYFEWETSRMEEIPYSQREISRMALEPAPEDFSGNKVEAVRRPTDALECSRMR